MPRQSRASTPPSWPSRPESAYLIRPYMPPQASFGGEEFYPDFALKAAVLVVRLIRNHPLPDGNKRLAWGCLRMFVVLNDHRLDVTDDEAVNRMRAIAAGEVDEASMAEWLNERLQ